MSRSSGVSWLFAAQIATEVPQHVVPQNAEQALASKVSKTGVAQVETGHITRARLASRSHPWQGAHVNPPMATKMSLTFMAVFADVSMNNNPLSSAYACASYPPHNGPGE